MPVEDQVFQFMIQEYSKALTAACQLLQTTTMALTVADKVDPVNLDVLKKQNQAFLEK